MTVTLFIEHIVSDPKHRGGKPRIAGTGITVHDIADYHNAGLAIAEMVEELDLTPGQVYAALSYYFDHKVEIDAESVEAQRRMERTLADLEAKGRAISGEELRRRIEGRQSPKS